MGIETLWIMSDKVLQGPDKEGELFPDEYLHYNP